MITFSNNVKNALASDMIEAFYMLRILNSDGTSIFTSTSLYTDITLTDDLGANLNSSTNYHVYISDDSIISVDLPSLSTNVDREQYKIVVSANNLLNAAPTIDINTKNISLTNKEFGQLANTQNMLIGRGIEGRIGFINTTTGMPFTKLSDTILIYKGTIESIGYLIKTQEMGESLLQITGSSPMRNLDLKSGLYLSKDYIRQVNLNDSCCDQIYEGSGAVTLKWGRI